MFRRQMSILVLVVLFVSVLVGCAKSPAGKWNMAAGYGPASQSSVVLNKDGTWAGGTASGTWRMNDDGTLTLTSSLFSYTFRKTGPDVYETDSDGRHQVMTRAK